MRHGTALKRFEGALSAPTLEGFLRILLASGKLIPVHFRRLILPSLFWHNIKGILK